MKIITFGDSITDMRRGSEQDAEIFTLGHGYPQLLAGDLKYENPKKYEVINRGNSGNRIVDLYARIKKDVWNLKPDVISILIGINDIWLECGEGKNGVDIVRFEKVYRMLIEDTLERLPNVKCIILEPFVLYHEAIASIYDELIKVKEYAKVEKQIAKDYHLEFVPLQELFDKKAAETCTADWLFDGVHPTSAGSRLIANELLKVFKERIDK
ncbi:MAG: lysophospholipase [Clostridia bacterium]|nr:lysophospholipase [Clostridia bacterium]